jgi:hypothetical protein
MEDSTSDSTKTAGLEKGSTLSPTKIAIWAAGKMISILAMASTSTPTGKDTMGNF